MELNDDDNTSRHQSRFCDVADEPRRMLPPIYGYENEPLVPIEVAVKNLVKYISSIEEQASIAKQRCQTLPDNDLSIDEAASIRLYTMHCKIEDQRFYTILNTTLRSEDRSLLQDWFPYLKLFISALLKIPSTRQEVFRGVKLDLFNEYSEEQNVVWWAFSSCTTSMKVVERPSFLGTTGRRTLFKIDCYSGKEIQKYSDIPSEQEVLLIAATQLQIISSRDAGNGLYVIEMKEIKPKYSLNGINPEVFSSPDLRIKHPVTKKPPRPIGTKDPLGRTSRNPDLERLIVSMQSRSVVTLDGLELSEDDMRDIVDQVVIQGKCENLTVQNSKTTPDGISTLAAGVCRSTTLEKLDLSSNRLSDDDVFCLAEKLQVMNSTHVTEWKCCVWEKSKVK